MILGSVDKFCGEGLIVFYIGWNFMNMKKLSGLMDGMESERVYFVYSYRATSTEVNKDWVFVMCDYGGEFIVSV